MMRGVHERALCVSKFTFAQGIAPTMVMMTLAKLIRTIVGAIPCACPGGAGGAYLTGIIPCGCPGLSAKN